MVSRGFSVGNALKIGWNEMKKHWLFFLVFMLVMIVVAMLAIGAIAASFLFKAAHPVLGVLAALLFIVIESIMALGLLKSTLHVVRGEPLQFADLFGEAKKVVAYIIAHILYVIMLFLPYLILVLIPVFIFGLLHLNEVFIGLWSLYGAVIAYVIATIVLVKYVFYPYAIVDKSVGPIEALKISHKITHGCKWDVLFLYIGMSVVVYLGILFLGIGVLFAVPLSFIAMASVYHRLSVP